MPSWISPSSTFGGGGSNKAAFLSAGPGFAAARYAFCAAASTAAAHHVNGALEEWGSRFADELARLRTNASLDLIAELTHQLWPLLGSVEPEAAARGDFELWQSVDAHSAPTNYRL